MLADAKKYVYDEDILALVTQQSVRGPDRFEFVYLDVASSTGGRPHAAVCMRVDGEEFVEAAVGDGMVDACYKAISRITGLSPKLERYTVKGVTGGTDAQGEVLCLIHLDGVSARGQGSHTDIVQASALAYVNALNNLDCRRRQEQPLRVEGP